MEINTTRKYPINLCFTTLNQWSADLKVQDIRGVRRSLAQIRFGFKNQLYWIVVTSMDLLPDRPNFYVDGYGQDGPELELLLNEHYIDKIKEVFTTYQMEFDFKNLNAVKND